MPNDGVFGSDVRSVGDDETYSDVKVKYPLEVYAGRGGSGEGEEEWGREEGWGGEEEWGGIIL